MSATGESNGSCRNTHRYEHLPRGTSWWVYEDLNSAELIAERIDNGDKMRFEGWDELERSEYWAQEN